MSPVATEPETRQWTRTPEQNQVVRDHLTMIEQDWSTVDPDLLALLKDTDVMDSKAIMAFLGYTATTRVFQLSSNYRNWGEADQLPHPSAMPEADASFGRRGPREIRGTARGRIVHWAIHSGRFRWDPFAKKLVPQTGIQFGGAPRK